MRIITDDKSLTPPYNPGLWPALDWSAEFWTGILDNLDVPLVVLGEDAVVLLANSEAVRVLGLAGAVGRSLPERLETLAADPGAGRRLARVQTAEGLRTFMVTALLAEGHPRVILAAGRGDYLTESQDHGESVSGGEAAMAGEMGRKVLGPLAGIELYASILGDELKSRDDGDLASITDEIRQGVKELNEYLTSFESMTRTLHLRLERLSLSEVVDRALEAMGGIFKAHNVGVLVDQRSLMVMADRELLVQMFLNLMLNAVEAMPGGGRLMVDIREDAEGRSEVVLTDTGPGVSAGLTKEIFNPFFTTKDQPLGLGLPVSRRVAEAHRGCIKMGRDVTLGARVSVTLPKLEPKAAGDPAEGRDDGRGDLN